VARCGKLYGTILINTRDTDWEHHPEQLTIKIGIAAFFPSPLDFHFFLVVVLSWNNVCNVYYDSKR
jgi:hypothetical protein